MEITHKLDDFGICNIVGDNFGHFWEMPAIPFLLKETYRSCPIKYVLFRKRTFTRIA